MNLLMALLLAYLLGSIPSAYLAGQWGKGIDLRAMGSGNLGFTNAWRNLGPKWSIPVLLFDIGKGAAAVLIAKALLPGMELLPIFCGLVAILGHSWTIFLGFKGGGKGVATSAGVFLALAPIPMLITAMVFLSVLFTTRYMSLASIFGALTLAICGWLFRLLKMDSAPSLPVFLFSLAVAALIVFKHRSNIHRIRNGTEPKLGKKQQQEAAS